MSVVGVAGQRIQLYCCGWETSALRGRRGVAEASEVRGGRSVNGARNLRKQVSALVPRAARYAGWSEGGRAPHRTNYLLRRMRRTVMRLATKLKKVTMRAVRSTSSRSMARRR